MAEPLQPNDPVAPGRYIDASGRNMPTTRDRRGQTPKLPTTKLVAAALQETWTPQSVEQWLTAVIRGQEPNPVAGQVTAPIDWTTRRWAFATLLDRMLGKVKAHVVLEGSVESKVTADIKIATFALDARDLDGTLPGDKLEAFREMQRALIASAKRKVDALKRGISEGVTRDSDVIEAFGTEMPAKEGSRWPPQQGKSLEPGALHSRARDAAARRAPGDDDE